MSGLHIKLKPGQSIETKDGQYTITNDSQYTTKLTIAAKAVITEDTSHDERKN